MVEATVLGPGKELRTTRNATCPEWAGELACAWGGGGAGARRQDKLQDERCFHRVITKPG